MGQSIDESGISETAIQIFSWIAFALVCQLINIFGIVTNVINIICFAKQGFDDSVNISLIGLAVSDLCSLVTMIWTCISVTPAMLAADLPFEPMDVMFLASAMPHFSFTRVSACLTAMITLERCLCITAPLKIKSIITPNRASVITCCVFIIFFCSGVPVFAASRLDTKFSTARNKTLIGIVSTDNREIVDLISFAVNNFFIPFVAFIIIVVCTTILSVKLRSQSKWRRGTVGRTQDEKLSSRNQKAAKMVVMISVLFIVCFIPVNVTMLAAGLIPELLIHGKYMNISIIIAGFGYIMEGINSSMNIFIYYHISSVYRDNFTKLFRLIKSHGNKIQ